MAIPVELAQVSERVTYFEIHALHDDRWMIDGAAETRQVAIEDAGFMLRRPGVAAVRVIKETFDPRNDLSACRVVYERKNPGAGRPGRRQSAMPQASKPARINAPMTKDELERMMVAQPDAQSGGLSLFAVLSMALGLIGAFVIILSNLAG